LSGISVLIINGIDLKNGRSKRMVSELISVILPVYNCEQSVEAAVDSVLKQTYKDLELIIVDDASDDKTADICRKLSREDGRISIITNQNNCGALESRIKAAQAAKGVWIALIDADDIWNPEKIAKQVAFRDKNNADIIYTASSFIDKTGKAYDWVMHVPSEVSYKELLKQNIISNSSVLVRKDDYIKYSPMDWHGKELHEDYACWLSMLKAGRRACGIDEPLLTYRVAKESRSGNKFKAARMNMTTYRYVGLSLVSSLINEFCYAFNGLAKYSHFR
jgi:teichuronic acid biosynthesis glycosyltransferase TuaG